MLLAMHDYLAALMVRAGIECTADQRDIQVPGAFVTVTNIDQWSIDGTTCRAECDLILMVRDLGGREDLRAKDEILMPALDALTDAGLIVHRLSTTEQATPPDHSPVPAIKISLYMTWEIEEMEEENGT